MALSNPHEKVLKKEPPEVKEESPFLRETLLTEQETAWELLSLLNRKLVASEGGPHAATVLSAAAWLTGTSLYRSVQPKENSLSGSIVTAHEVYQEWENLVYLLEKYNFQRVDIPVGRVVLAAMAAPPLFKPQTDIPHAQSELQEQYNAVLMKHGFDDLEGARVGVILCSMLIQQYGRDGIIDPDAATGVVAQGIFEAARQCVRS